MGKTLGKEKGEPTPNRVQSTDAGVSVKISLLNLCRATRKKTRLSSLELPRCEGGKDHEVGLKEKGEMPCGVIVRMGYRPDGALPLFIGGGDQLCW